MLYSSILFLSSIFLYFVFIISVMFPCVYYYWVLFLFLELHVFVFLFPILTVKCLFYVKHIELPLCMKWAILIKLPCLALPCLA